MSEKKILIIIPTYNEGLIIGKVISEKKHNLGNNRAQLVKHIKEM